MAFSIQTNVNSLVAQENLRVNSNFQSQTIQRLTSGYRINSSADDAAGLAIANQFRSDTAELTQGVRNANDGISQLQIIDGGMNNVSKMLDRLRTLATQSSTATFTDDQRVVANQEFQSLLGEINRQSQSIGLDTNGQFNKALSVFIGGGKATGTGANSTDNGSVNLDLSSSSVDTKSLGLSGMQALAGSVDLSATSATSVSNIVNNASNKAALSANPGYTTFYMTGSGFADDSKIAVSVNLNGVTDAATLANAINTGIQSAGIASTAAAAAFKSAGVVASVHTGSTGAQQLAFTSSVSAFQVQAGDQMSNALMGNFSTGATGASMATQVVGAAHAAAGAGMAANPVYVKISGAGLAAPVTLALPNAGATVGSMVQAIQTDLADATNQPALAASGITLSDVNGHYVFANAKNQAFSVEVTGDTGNKLGFGAFQASSQMSADYTSIAGASYNAAALNNTTAGAAVNLEFSIGGGSAIAIDPLSLAGGNAVAAKYTSGAISSPVNIVTGQNDTLSFAVDSNNVSVVLAAAGDSGTATAGTAKFLNIPTTPDVVIADTAAASTAGTHKFASGDANTVITATAGKAATAGVNLSAVAGDLVIAGGGKNQFSLSLDGGASKTITLAANTYDHTKFAAGGTDATDLVYELQQAVNSQFTGAAGGPTATVGTDGSGHITITSNTVGANSAVAIFDAADNTLSGQLGLSAGMHVGAGFNTMSVSVDGGAAKLISVAAGTYTVGHLNDNGSQDIVKALNDALGAAFTSNTPVASVDGSGKVVITSATKGVASNVTIQDDPANPGLMGALGLSAGSHAGTDPTSMWVSVDGGAAKQVQIATGTYKAASSGQTGANDVLAALNTALGNAFTSNTPVASIDASGKVVITSATKGANSSVAISDDATYPGLVASLGLTGASSQNGHDGATADTIAGEIQSQMNTQLAGKGAGATVTVASGVITITNNAAGAGTNHAFAAMGGNAAGAGQWANALFTAAAGVNRTGDNLASAITNELAANTTLGAAGLTAAWDGAAHTITVSGTSAFRMNSGAAAAQGTVVGTVDLTNGADFTASPMTLKVATDGAAAVTVNLSQKYTTAGAIAADIKNQLAAAGSNANVTTTSINGKTYLELQAVTTGTTGSVQVLSGGTANTTLGLTDNGVKANSAQVDIGFGVTNSTNTGALGLANANSSLSVIDASGTSQTGALAFQGLTLAGGKTQALTISANDANGGMQSATITLAATGAGTTALANDGTGKDLDSAVKFINSQLQQTNNATLKQIVAVKEVVGGSEEINFISGMSGFQVGIGSASNKEGLNAGVAKAAMGVETGASSTVSILSLSDALGAVNAVAAAVAKLGSAQAAVGKGQNQLNYAVNLAQSQISNFSAAESRIRDADVASEAANLTKASVLQQASIAAMAQANSAPQAVLALLRG